MEKRIYSLSDLPRVARSLVTRFGTTVYLLTGELGAGKTTLVKEMCAQLGVSEPTSSPTFSIVNQYRGGAGLIYHLDCYRLRDVEEALDAGLEEIFAEAGATVFVEWPAVIEPLLPTSVVRLRLEHTPGGATRSLTITTGPDGHPDDEQ